MTDGCFDFCAVKEKKDYYLPYFHFFLKLNVPKQNHIVDFFNVRL